MNKIFNASASILCLSLFIFKGNTFSETEYSTREETTIQMVNLEHEDNSNFEYGLSPLNDGPIDRQNVD